MTQAIIINVLHCDHIYHTIFCLTYPKFITFDYPLVEISASMCCTINMVHHDLIIHLSSKKVWGFRRKTKVTGVREGTCKPTMNLFCTW